ncbi:MAG: glycosyltransferase family 39 protein, partial [bacterium]
INGRARFRPVFSLHLAATVFIFRTNLTSHTVYMVLLGVLTLFLLYRFAFNIGFNKWQAVIFSLLTLAGSSAIIWGQLLDAENIGMFILSLSLYFMSKSIISDKYKTLFTYTFILLLFLTALCKESFALIIPAVIFLYIWLKSNVNKTSILQSAKASLAVIVISVLYVIVLFLIITLTIGVNNQNYAGVDFKLLLNNFLPFFFEEAILNILFCLSAAGILLIMAASFKKDQRFKTGKKQIYYLCIWWVLLVVPQLALYAKTGMEERYYLPFMLGFSFMSVFVLKEIFSVELIPKVIKYSYLILMIAYLIYQFAFRTIPVLTKFADECRATSKMLNSISETKGKEKLLIIMDPVQNFHEVYSIKIYMNHERFNKNYKYEFLRSSYIHPFFASFYADSVAYKEYIDGVVNELGAGNILYPEDGYDISEVLILGNLEKEFLEKNFNRFNESNYIKQVYGRYVLYKKR